jgi:hypothetical protein
VAKCFSGRARPLGSLLEHAFVALASVSRSGSEEGAWPSGDGSASEG